MTTVRIAQIEPWPGKRMGGHGFRISSFLVVLADDSGGRAIPVWLNGPEGHGLFRGGLDPALTTGPRHGRDTVQANARIGFTAAGSGESRQMTARIGYALAMAAATGAPVRVADPLMDRLAVPARDDLAGQFTRDVPLPRKRRGWSRLLHGHRRPVHLATR